MEKESKNNSVLEKLYLPFPFSNYTIRDLIGVNYVIGKNVKGENYGLYTPTIVKHGLLMYIKFLLIMEKFLLEEMYTDEGIVNEDDALNVYENICDRIITIELYFYLCLKENPYKVVDLKPLAKRLRINYDKYEVYLNNIYKVYICHVTEFEPMPTVDDISNSILDEYNKRLSLKNITEDDSLAYLKQLLSKKVETDDSEVSRGRRLSIELGKYKNSSN